ncbi:MAG: YfhO family protein [Chloroflexi bacterium]|nr:YfhO family protein [Chloroflexota bacterium]
MLSVARSILPEEAASSPASMPANSKAWFVPLAAIAGLWLAVLAYFWPLITLDAGARQYVGAGDFREQFFQYHSFAASELAHGRLAQWDPYMYSGHPFQADMQTAVLYPISFANEWLHRFDFSFLALEWESVLHFGLAATFTFLLVRRLTGSTAAGLLGGLVFALGGFLTSYPLDDIEVLESTVWLPLQLYCIERAARGKRPSLWLALAGAALALATLAGHPQTLLYAAYLGVAYALFRLPWRQWWRLVWFPVAAIGLAAAQLLPTAQLVGLSARGPLTPDVAGGGLVPSDLLGLLTGAGAGRILYVGVIPLGLALTALVLRPSPAAAEAGRVRVPSGSPKSIIIFWSAVALVSGVVALGSHGPLFAVFFRAAPAWNLFRDQERVVVCFALALAILTGYGLAALQRRAVRAANAIGAAAVVATILNLFVTRQPLSAVAPPDIDQLKSFLAPVLYDRDIFRVRVSEASIGHDDGNLLGLQLVTGDSVLELGAFKTWAEDQPGGRRVTEDQLLRLDNVYYVVSSRSLCDPCQPSDQLQLLAVDRSPRQVAVTDPLPRFVTVPELYLYKFLYPLPRAYFVTQALAVQTQRQAIDAINQPGFDPAQTVLLQTQAVARASPADLQAPLHTDVVGYAPGFVDVRTTTDRPAYLVLSEVRYPDWQVTIDGQSAATTLADGLFMALDTPAGQHHVVLRFVPKLFYIGAVISVASLAALIVAAARAVRRP